VPQVYRVPVRIGSLYSDRVRDRLNQLLRELQAIPDPQDRAKAYSDVLGVVPGFQAELRELRQSLLTELYDTGLSYGQIAAVTGVTRGRVKQIIDGQRVSGRFLKAKVENGEAPPAD